MKTTGSISEVEIGFAFKRFGGLVLGLGFRFVFFGAPF